MNPNSTTSRPKLEADPVSGLESWARLCIVSHFLGNAMVQPKSMQPCIPVRTNGEWIASPQTLVSLSILVKIGRRFKAALCPPRKHHNLALSNSEEDANASPTSVSVRSTCAHTLTIQFSLAAVGVGADDCSTHKAHAGCFALLPNGPWTCERRYGVDKVGVVLRKRYQQRDLSSIAIILPQSEVRMGHPATNKDECERGIEKEPGR